MKRPITLPGWLPGLLILLIAAMMPAHAHAETEWVAETTIGNVTYKVAKNGSAYKAVPYPKDDNITTAAIQGKITVDIDGKSQEISVESPNGTTWESAKDLKWLAFERFSSPILDKALSKRMAKLNIFLFGNSSLVIDDAYNYESNIIYSSYGTADEDVSWGIKTSTGKYFKGRIVLGLKSMHGYGVGERVSPCGVKFEFNPKFIYAIGCEPIVEATRDAHTFKPLEKKDDEYVIYGKDNKIRYSFPGLSQTYECSNFNFGWRHIFSQDMKCIGGAKFKVRDNLDVMPSNISVYHNNNIITKRDDGYYIAPAYGQIHWAGEIEDFHVAENDIKFSIPELNDEFKCSYGNFSVNFELDKLWKIQPGAKVLLKKENDSTFHELDEKNQLVLPLSYSEQYFYPYIKTISGDTLEAYKSYYSDRIEVKELYYKNLNCLVYADNMAYASIKLKLYQGYRDEPSFENFVKEDEYLGKLKSISVREPGTVDNWLKISGIAP